MILKETINNMVDRLSIFCNEVQRVAKDVGVDGIMGGQADVAGLKGRWKEITTDVNTMANNLVRLRMLTRFRLLLTSPTDGPSPSIRRHHQCSHRRRLYQTRRSRSLRRNGRVEKEDQPDGVQLTRQYPEKHTGQGSRRTRQQDQIRVLGQHVARNSNTHERHHRHDTAHARHRPHTVSARDAEYCEFASQQFINHHRRHLGFVQD